MERRRLLVLGASVTFGAAVIVAAGAEYVHYERQGEQLVHDDSPPIVGTARLVKVRVPNVVGEQLTAAEATLARTNLTWTVKQEQNSEPFGQVLAQAPPAGQLVAAGSAVLITFSTQTSQ